MATNTPTTTTTPWYLYPVTQDYGQNGETGIDIGTPVHTPLTSLVAGTVADVSYHAYGWQVVVDVPSRLGGIIKETLIHMDQVAVRVGQQVQPGSFLGLSGGEPPLTSPKYSSGPHTELDFFTGTPFASPAINPDPVFRALGNATAHGQTPVGSVTGSPLDAGGGLCNSGITGLPGISQICSGIVGGSGTAVAGADAANSFLGALTNPSTWLRVGGAILGLLLILVAVAAMLKKE